MITKLDTNKQSEIYRELHPNDTFTLICFSNVGGQIVQYKQTFEKDDDFNAFLINFAAEANQIFIKTTFKETLEK